VGPDHGRDHGLGLTHASPERLECTVPVLKKRRPARPGPQAPVGSGGHAEHGGTGTRRGGWRLHEQKGEAVEAHETLLGRDPQVAVMGLGNGIHGAARIPSVAAPALAKVLGRRALRVQCVRRQRTAHQQPRHQQHPDATTTADA
jgi:hypothetical protein